MFDLIIDPCHFLEDTIDIIDLSIGISIFIRNLRLEI
jgi:hypothetical protein